MFAMISKILPTLTCLILSSVGVAFGQAREIEESSVAKGFQIIRSDVADRSTVPVRFPFSHGFGSGVPISLGNGRVLLIYRPPKENQLESAISNDGGKTWTAFNVVARNTIPEVTICRPTALRTKDGAIWVFYNGYIRYDAQEPSKSKSDIWSLRSVDGGQTWQDHHRIWEGYSGMMNGVIETRAGTIIVPMDHPGGFSRWVSSCLVSKDRGKSWTFVDGTDIGEKTDAGRRWAGLSGGGMEPTVIQLKDGRIWMLMRTILGQLWQSFSGDDGLTWTKPVPSNISCGGTAYMTRLASGRVALVWQQANWSSMPDFGYPDGFDQASIALSDDDGKTWHRPIVYVKIKRACHSLIAEPTPGHLLITMASRLTLLSTTEDVLLKG